MNTTEQFKKRFAELAEKSNELRFEERESSSGYTFASESGPWRRWATNAQDLLRVSVGEQSPYYTNFMTSFNACMGRKYEFDELKELFLGAKEAFESGYIFNIDLRISGEVFGDLVALAKLSLSEGHKDVAAVLAAAALEDALKRFAATNRLEVSDKDMSQVIAALKSKSLVQGAQKTLLDSMPRFRNLALHAEWEKIQAPEVGSAIGFVEQFLLTNFS